MDLAVLQDIRELMAGTGGVKLDLEVLEKDHAVWARNREGKDLAQLIKRVEKLQTDVSMMTSDFVCASCYDEEEGITKSLHDAFACLDNLFQDLKKARRELNDAYIHPEEIKQLEIDWGRFMKVIGRIQKHLHFEKSL